MHRRILGVTLTILSASLLLAACGEEQAPVNRVEAYALPKTLFQGEWYYNKTVVDTPASRSIAWENMQGNFPNGLARIRWDIQENYLYARSSFEQIQGAKKESQDTGAYLGSVVGAWKITKHFDIKRSYNPSTGEENNVLEENAMDCKWFDCQYLRVDWSKNFATDVNFMGWGFPAIVKEPAPFSEQDASDPRFKPIFDKKAGYIDFTDASVIQPRNHPGAKLYYGVDIPMCYFFEDMTCESEVIKVRNSFLRRDPNRDYVPKSLRGKKDEWFGIFVVERFNYIAAQGLSYWAKQHFATRHNLWAKSHTETPCTKDADCKTAGSVCNVFVPFHKNDVVTDSDFDGLPDSFEAEKGLNAKSGDSDGDGIPDPKDDADGNGLRDLDDFHKWDKESLEFRCTIPEPKRDPKPITYFISDFPRSLLCDEHNNSAAKDKDPTPCKPWKYIGDKAGRAKASSLHVSQMDYDETYFKIHLRGVHGWSDADYTKWIAKHDIGQFSGAKADVLKKFGDAQNGYYAFAICPNNPVAETDPWPCRFPKHSWTQAKELMDKGFKFNHRSYAQGIKLSEPTTAAPSIRIGDVRYNIINWMYQYTPYRFGGIAGLANDPRTGEIVSGMANVSSIMDYGLTARIEMLDLLNGKIKPTDYIEGVDLSKWVDQVNKASGSKQQRVLNQPQLAAMYGAMKQKWLKNIPRKEINPDFTKLKDSKGRSLNNRQIKAKLMDEFHKSGILDPARAKIDIKAIRGTELEKKMINREVLGMAGVAPSFSTSMMPKSVTAEMLSKASPIREGLLPKINARRTVMEQLREDYHMDFFGDMDAMVDDGLLAFARRYKNLSPEQLRATMRRQLMIGYVTHEVGHSVGLQHNFGGSEDALNFPKEYWQVRTNNFKQNKVCSASGTVGPDMLCPLFMQPANNYQLGLDPTNKLGGMYEYANTSVMEYHRNNMLHPHLGRYDKAALMFSHANKVEVFNDKGKVPDGLGSDYEPNVFEEWWDSNGSVLMLYNTRAQSYHYTNWYPSMGSKLWEESNRSLVDADEVVEVRGPTGRAKGWYHVDEKTKTKKVRVPYVFCKRTSVNLGDNCLTSDEGVDQYEKMKTFIDSWNTYYVMSAFPRQRVRGTSINGYINKKWDFYFRFKDFNNGYALYQALFHQWYDQTKIDEFFSDPLNGYGAYTVSINDAFNTAMQVLTMPDMRYFGDKTTGQDGQTYFPESDFTSTRFTDLTNSRHYSTEYYDANYEQTCGYYWRECLHHIGFFWDKLIAMIMLSDSHTNFVGQDTSEDVRKYRISFFNNYSDQIIDAFGGILSHDYKKVSPWYDSSKPSDKTVVDTNGNKWVNRVAMRNYAQPSKDIQPVNGAPLQAGTRFSTQLYAAIYGMFHFQGNFNSEFIERGRLWKKGKGTTWTITPTDKIDGVVEFVDPLTGSTYVSINYKDKRGIAQRMLSRANTLKGRTKYCTTAPPAPAPAPPDVCVTGADTVKAEQELRSYRDLLDIMVQISSIYDANGHNWGWNPYYP